MNVHGKREGKREVGRSLRTWNSSIISFGGSFPAMALWNSVRDKEPLESVSIFTKVLRNSSTYGSNRHWAQASTQSKIDVSNPLDAHRCPSCRRLLTTCKSASADSYTSPRANQFSVTATNAGRSGRKAVHAVEFFDVANNVVQRFRRLRC